ELRFVFDSAKIADKKLTDEEKQELCRLFDRLNHIGKNNQLEKIQILNPKNLADRVWQKIWISTGKEPEKCLYNVVEMFIFKFLSDLKVLEYPFDFYTIYELSKNNSEAALKTYAQSVRKEIKEMFPKSILDGTTVINGTIFVNETGEPNLAQVGLFKQVLEEFHKYEKNFGSFNKIDKQFKTRLYESFLRESAGVSAMGQYFTPRNVVNSIINMINPEYLKEDIKICDPFCGVGGFLLELLNSSENLKKQFRPRNGIIDPKVEILGFDKGSDEKEDERTIILAKANMLIYFSDILSNNNTSVFMKELSEKAFNKVFKLVKTNLGTLGVDQYRNYFDLIITNPPYVTSGVSSIKQEIKDKGLEFLYPSNGNGLEGLAVEWIINALKPKGKAFIVLPDGIMSRQGDKRLRNRILDTCIIDAIISLPSRTFFATPKKTYIVALTKKEDDDKKQQQRPFFTYLVSEIGETRDAKRFETPANDLPKMSEEFRYFMSNPEKYKSDNLRCKIHDIQRLKDQHWLIDRDWSYDEKKELNIHEDITVIDDREFFNLLSDMGDLMVNFAKEFKSSMTVEADQNVQYKSVELKEIFDFSKSVSNTSKFTKSLINQNQGDIPVYGATQFHGKPTYGYVQDNLEGVKYFENCLTWNIDGSLGCFYREGRFSLSEKVIPLYLKQEFIDDLDLSFLSYILIQKANEYGFSRDFKPNQTQLKEVCIDIPIKQDGSFDLQAQKRIAKKYQNIESKRFEIINMTKYLIDKQVRVEPYQ
ncbi:hypothetical protein BKH42_08635, partial [Helicobacter sp. 13S00482-2]|uniref:N-6 DNA methylase n=1 Tax=Helicobacter sp. 13S00482-2 TaxID=1476200 RepID=UPI000BDA3FD7